MLHDFKQPVMKPNKAEDIFMIVKNKLASKAK